MNIQGKAKKANTYDAIVVGSGVSGGWAAKELSEKGLKVLMLERGYHVEHISGYPDAMKESWEFPHRGRVDKQAAEDYWAVKRTGYAANEENRGFFVKDSEHPYEEKRRFDWVRGYNTGGRSKMWGRQSYRWNKRDFTANLEEGVAVDWPIRYEDLAPWYDHAERFAGISGTAEGLDVLPDGVFQPGMEMNCVERHFKKEMQAKFNERHATIGRVAHLTNPTQEQMDLGRSACQFRNKCIRGCPYGAYFSTQSATLPAAMKTGNLELINDKIVYQVIYDDKAGKATGVKAIDQNTKEEIEYFAKIIFLNASAINSAWIMMQSKSSRHPNGLGNASDQLGRNIMDHHLASGAGGKIEGFMDQYYFGNRPNALYIPRFTNWGTDKRDFLRGFGYQGGANRGHGKKVDETFGVAFKEALGEPGGWSMHIQGFGEALPDPTNRMTLTNNKDQWGLPVIEFDAWWGENEQKMRIAMRDEAVAMLEATGFIDVKGHKDEERSPGIGIHEMGTARMGHEEKSSVLNKYNQVWGAQNVFVTDGACMTSSSCVNPSLTYMALTARAAAYAVDELKKGNL